MKLDVKDFAAGLGVSLFGLFFFVNSFRYDLGSPQAMGPGYFPMLVGGLCFIVGFFIMVPAIGRTSELPHVEWRPLLAVVGSVAAFALGLTYLGFVPAVFLGIGICSLAGEGVKPIQTLILAAAATAAFYLVFVVALSVNIPAFGKA